jgi:hypothetical protein
VGGDASDSIDIYPRGGLTTAERSWPRRAEAVTGDIVPACFGCYLLQACPFFPAAERQLLESYGKTFKCNRRPGGESVLRASATVVNFADPATVHGTGDPSGGGYPATGAVTYKPSYGSATETCTLPRSEHAVCAAVLNVFIDMWDRYSQK